jgi:hypothetical protein
MNLKLDERRFPRPFAIVVLLLVFGGYESRAVDFKPAQALPGADFFTNGSVPQISIQIAPSDIESLRREPREFVRATVKENDTI